MILMYRVSGMLFGMNRAGSYRACYFIACYDFINKTFNMELILYLNQVIVTSLIKKRRF